MTRMKLFNQYVKLNLFGRILQLRKYKSQFHFGCRTWVMITKKEIFRFSTASPQSRDWPWVKLLGYLQLHTLPLQWDMWDNVVSHIQVVVEQKGCVQQEGPWLRRVCWGMKREEASSEKRTVGVYEVRVETNVRITLIGQGQLNGWSRRHRAYKESERRTPLYFKT